MLRIWLRRETRHPAEADAAASADTSAAATAAAVREADNGF